MATQDLNGEQHYLETAWALWMSRPGDSLSLDPFDNVFTFWQNCRLMQQNCEKMKEPQLTISMMRGTEEPDWKLDKKLGRKGRFSIRVPLTMPKMAMALLEEICMLAVGERIELHDLTGVSCSSKVQSYILYVWLIGERYEEIKAELEEICKRIENDSSLASSRSSRAVIRLRVEYHPYYDD